MTGSAKTLHVSVFYIPSCKCLDHLATNIEIFIALQETLRKFEVLKICQKLDANMEGFR